MAKCKTKRPYKKPKAKEGRKVKATQQSYSLEVKSKARAWRKQDGKTILDIQKKLKAEYGIDVPVPTLCTWWN